jgi:hypothetical protein
MRACRSGATRLMQHSGVDHSKVGRNVMFAVRNLAKGLWSKLLLLAAVLALLSGSAAAQMGGMGGGKPSPPDTGPTPLEQQRQKQIDNDYKAATKNIPNQKPKDPWGDVRSAPTGKTQ